MQNVQFDAETTEKPICATLIAIEISKASSAVYTWLWGRLGVTCGCQLPLAVDLSEKSDVKACLSVGSMTSPPH